ncbi:hypothetical protein ASD92_25920 [Massilia sp. Root1485]|nr:hypothetical protein ASD92_25920 [Massilia sp. Root1485]
MVSMPDGVAVAWVRMQNIVVIQASGDRKFINVQDGDHLVTFLLDARQCRHVARLLINGLDDTAAEGSN